MESGAVLTEIQFSAAYRGSFQRTIQFLQSSGVPVDLAEEIAQAAWVRGWECRDQLKNHAAIGIWVNSIAKNLFRVACKRKKNFCSTADIDEDSKEALILSRNPSHSTEANSDVWACLSDIPDEDRDLLVRHYMEGWSSNELGPVLGISPVTVRVRILRIKNSIRAKMHLPMLDIDS